MLFARYLLDHQRCRKMRHPALDGDAADAVVDAASAADCGASGGGGYLYEPVDAQLCCADCGGVVVHDLGLGDGEHAAPKLLLMMMMMMMTLLQRWLWQLLQPE